MPALKDWLISFLPVGYCIMWFRSHSRRSPNSSSDGTCVIILQFYAFHSESIRNLPFSTVICLHLLLLTERWKMSFLYHLAPTQKLSKHQAACFSFYLSWNSDSVNQQLYLLTSLLASCLTMTHMYIFQFSIEALTSRQWDQISIRVKLITSRIVNLVWAHY